ncbi:uncharacterized protein CIMG_04150 [Coccidioides immitis RS]|uniref:Uncharacterized protein n=4 Tax=Coccidioides immitis TaxID=5501 RepID=A0A0E1RWZ1_COCIM|nr:uncharacterized protein CIMG_04150 [Coccidioides immitis RS]EAS33126.1 hypothetical protein CIMG_04150 [Coccidioides immitis RS]KMP08416.1 hypothetical protein CIRG_08097 [Coccidioides immitis RMSCC 2394]KMU72330.1 hypothetical protein CISG_02978 [Coccidioides immitis RMSCC 3703]KMU87231.1 hypothetical protein CIHG_04675 [Coccidioides immitis H538.4]
MGTWFTAHEFYPYGATNEHTIPACHVLAKICRSIKVRVKKGMPLVFHWLAYGERGSAQPEQVTARGMNKDVTEKLNVIFTKSGPASSSTIIRIRVDFNKAVSARDIVVDIDARLVEDTEDGVLHKNMHFTRVVRALSDQRSACFPLPRRWEHK